MLLRLPPEANNSSNSSSRPRRQARQSVSPTRDPLQSVYDGRDLLGHVFDRSDGCFDAATADGKVIGEFPASREAADAILVQRRHELADARRRLL